MTLMHQNTQLALLDAHVRERALPASASTAKDDAHSRRAEMDCASRRPPHAVDKRIEGVAGFAVPCLCDFYQR